MRTLVNGYGYLSRSWSIRIKFVRSSAYSNYASTPLIPSTRKTFSHILQVCLNQRALKPGKQAHAFMTTAGIQPTVFEYNCLIQLYVKCPFMRHGLTVFEQMPHKNIVSWNAMIVGYFMSGRLDLARSIFCTMPCTDVNSWNSMLSGYLHNNGLYSFIDILFQMRESGVMFDHTTLAVSLELCSSIEDHGLGVQIHGIAVKIGFDNHVVTGCALVGMYAKCNKLEDSVGVLFELAEKNWNSWRAVIAGCLQNDQLIKGIQLFKEMHGMEIRLPVVFRRINRNRETT